MAGAKFGHIVSEETRRKISASQLGREGKKKIFCKRGHELDVVGRKKNNGACRACNSMHQSNYRADPYTKEQRAGYNLKFCYGITLEDKKGMLEFQRGLCAICSVTINMVSANVDHDHVSNKVRGLLCGSCNRGLGLLKDSADILVKATQYLLRSR